MSVENLKKLREPFPPNQISKLPKPTKKQTEELKADFRKGARCQLCGGWHQPEVIHLDYVGHAALTDRLLDVDPCWTWEPLAMNPNGLPVMDELGGMWIKLTVCGVTRLGYGHADDKTGGDAIKEVIGDALRNAAMRFGAALDLWHKGDLHAHEENTGQKLEDTTPTDVWSLFTPGQAARIRVVAQTCVTHFNEGKEWAAYEEYTSLLAKAVDTDFRNNVITALWEIWKPHSALRSAIKRLEAEEKAGEKA